MSRSSNSDAGGGCIGIVVLALIVAFLASHCSSDDEPASEPSQRPAATVTETATSPDVPETEEEEEAEADDNGGTGDQDFDGQVGIQFGYGCSPVGALGVAKDGRPAKCFMGKDGRARWGYDSNRG